MCIPLEPGVYAFAYALRFGILGSEPKIAGNESAKTPSQRRRAESNRRWRICNPLATAGEVC
jgi:hypothetical protein